jgi:DNA-binding CsgD family transcriptional regulator
MARRTTTRSGTFAGGEGGVLIRRTEPTEVAPALTAGDDVLRLGEEAVADLARVASAALGAALEAIPSPAFVVRLPSMVLLANERGRLLLSSDRDRVLGMVRSTTPPPRGPVRFAMDSAPDHVVVVVHDREGDTRSRLEAVTRRWGLTPRQSAVLAVVAQGESNRAVAGRLGCSEKTVELHVSALLAKTRCLSRSQLVASFWTDLG